MLLLVIIHDIDLIPETMNFQIKVNNADRITEYIVSLAKAVSDYFFLWSDFAYFGKLFQRYSSSETLLLSKTLQSLRKMVSTPTGCEGLQAAGNRFLVRQKLSWTKDIQW
jgi:hypothetical protein